MINSDNNIEFEMNFKFKMKDYRLKFVTKKAWIVSIILILIKVLFSFYGDSSP